MGQFPSIFQAEIHAIERCIQFNLDRKNRNKEIAINDLGRNNKVTLLWVPGYVGVEGNEPADTLARKGASAPLMGPEPFCGHGKAYVQEVLNKAEEEPKATHWQRLPGLRQPKDLLGNLNRAK